MASKMRVKPCPECNQESPVAKKSCECGYVFSKRATHGFQEMPVILTPERLRSLSRPVRKKQKLEDNDFVYANNTKTSKSKAGNLKDRQYTYGNSTRRIPSDIKKNNIEGHTILRSKNTAASASSKTGTQKYLTEKRKINIKSKQGNKSLEAIAKNIIKKSETSPAKSKTSGAPKSYPIRKRSSTSKYEPLLEMKLMRKNKKLRSDLREDEDKQISRKESKLEVDSSKLPEEKDHQSDQKIQKNTETIDGSHIEGVNANEKKGKKLQPDSKVLKTENELKLSSLEIEIDGEKDDNIKILSNNVNSPRTSSTPFVRLSPSVHELLLEHADQQIDVVTVKTEELMNWRKNLINTNLQANKALQVKKNFISDENSLLKIKIPKGIMKMMRQKAATAKKKAILTSTSKKNPAKNVAKRPIGRPRIHFKEDKPKRPLGRPRKHPEKKIKKMKVIRRSNIEGRRSDKLERFSKSAAVAELAEESISTLTDGSSESEIEVKVPKKRGRPKGTKDSKPRKQRQDRGQNRTGNFKTPIKGGRNARCFLSPPSLIASAKKERIKNEILEKVERDRLSKKLNGTQPMVIPPEKRELFSLILDEINRRIVSQSFSVR